MWWKLIAQLLFKVPPEKHQVQLISQADGDKVITAVWNLSLGLKKKGSNKSTESFLVVKNGF